jgi:CHAD domain-containing protein
MINVAPPIGPALLAYARAELEHADVCLGWRASRRHEGVHQARKSLRRARATLALADDAFGRSGEWIDLELQRINRSLSELRDGQALVEALDRLAKHFDADGHAALIARARRAAERRRADVARAPEFSGDGAQEPRRVLAVLRPALSALPWATLTPALVELALAHSMTAAEAAEVRAIGRGREPDWHRWRRRERRVSQQCRALKSVPLDREHEHHRASAERLGEAQDFSLLIRHCGRDSPFTRDDRRTLRELAGQRLQQLRARLVDGRSPLAAD